jgi:predicted transcriptional regulator
VAAEDPRRRDPGSRLALVPAVAKLAASVWWHAAERGIGVPLRIGSRIARAAAGGRQEPQPSRRASPADDRPTAVAKAADSSRSALRERGTELLRQSADVSHAEDLHPAYARILDNLSPDEARILRLLATEGPQPAIDVRRGLPLVSELVAPGLNMIGAEAGCRYPDRVHAYLDNLNRLGMIRFSRETLRDPNPYQVLEAQPEALGAMREAGRTARTVRRSIHLTPFGSDFCEVCLPAEPDGAADV